MQAIRTVAVAVMLMMTASSGEAFNERDSNSCAQDPDIARRIAACTRLLAAGGMSSSSRAIVLYNRGNALSKNDEHDRAIADFDEAIRLNPNDPDFYDSRGTAWSDKGDYVRAIADYDVAISRKPKDPVYLSNRGMAWYSKEDYEKASADFDKAIQLNPKSPVYYSNRGQSEFERKNYDRVIADFDTAIRLNSKDANYFYWRGRAWQRKADIQQAIRDFTEAIRLSPQEKKYFFQRASSYEDMGDYKASIADYTEVVRLDPGYVRAYSQRSLRYLALNDIDRAIADANEALRLNPRSNPAYHNRALIWRQAGDFDKAIADFTDAIRINPKEAHHYALRGDTWRMKGDLQRALDDLNLAIQISPDWTVAYNSRGDTFRYLGQYDRALADYDKASATGGAVDNLPGFVGRGLTFEKMGDLARARQEFEKVLASKTQIRSEYFQTNIDTARARLAALDSGAIQPVIPAAPRKAESQISVPTPVVAVPAAVPAIPALGRRIALVIGNAAYKNVSALTNPQHDAEKIAQSLRAIGFASVTLVNDATRENLINALRAFAEEADKADWAMVYYAGHGIEVNGVNYLIPVDARLATDRDVQYEAVALDQVTTSTDGARKLKLILLDACRDNPFAPQMRRTTAPDAVASAGPTAGGTVGTRSIGRGLGELKVTGATLVVYAAKHGQTALDGDGGNSPFAVALIQRVATPNVEINKLFRLVRDDVMEATAGRQEPYTYGSLPGREDFFFVSK